MGVLGRRGRWAGLAITAVVVWWAQPAVAQTYVSYNHLQGQIPRASESITALGADLMGDKVNLFNGALEFEHTDAELPGNSALKVAVTRRHTAGRHPTIQGAFGDWDLEAPRIGGVFTSKDGWVNSQRTTARCSQFSAPSYTSTTYSNGETVVTTYWYANEFWQGTHLHIPGAGSQEVLLRSAGNTAAPADGNSYPLVTREHWQLRCLPTLQNAAGEGFVAVSPDGTQYRFDWMATRSQPMLKGGNSDLGPIILGRREMMLMATLVTDRFGNTVRYTYSGSQLTRIEASDGRVITLTYGTNGLVSSVSDGSRTWSYSYAAQASPFTASSRLDQVNRPDGSRWQLALGGLVYPFPWELGEHANCDLPGAWPGGALTGSITHPSGAQGTFTTYYLSHSRSNVTKYCINKTGKPYDPKYAYWPQTLVSQSLASKALSGPGLAT